jgi:transposase InsO family protein
MAKKMFKVEQIVMMLLEAEMHLAKVLVDLRKTEYNTVRSHSSLNYQLSAPEAIKPGWLENAVVPSQELVQLMGVGHYQGDSGLP